LSVDQPITGRQYLHLEEDKNGRITRYIFVYSGRTARAAQLPFGHLYTTLRANKLFGADAAN
jgi:hypothetical protein